MIPCRGSRVSVPIICVVFFSSIVPVVPSVAVGGEGLAAADPHEAPEGYRAQTTSDPKIPEDQLNLLLKPLTKGQLEVEAAAWFELVRAKVKEIAAREIAVKRKNLEIRKVEDLAEAAEKATEAAREAEKAAGDAKSSVDAVAGEEAAEKAKEAEEKAAEAKKAADEARATEEKSQLDEEIRKAEEETVRKAEERAKQEAEARGGEEAGEAPPPTPAVGGDKASEVAAGAAGAENTEDLEKAAAAAKEVVEKKAEVKTALLKDLGELRSERTALADRLELVLDSLDSKGGNSELYRKYITTVSGLTIDVSDADATWSAIVEWLKSDEGGVRWARNLGKFLGILAGFWVLALVLGKVTERATRATKRMSGLLRDFVTTAVRRVILLVGVIVAVSALEVNINPVIAAIGGAAFIVAFALQGTLSNFASGMLILGYRPFDVGDVIEAGGVSGKVAAMNIVSTHIKTFDNKLMIVPNNKVWGDVITNATGTDMRRVDMVFGIGYADDIAKAQKILEDLVRNHELVLEQPEPVVKLNELGDSSVNFVCRPWVKTADYWTVYWDITRGVKEEFDRQGVSIPFPQRDIHVYHETPAPPEAAKAEV